MMLSSVLPDPEQAAALANMLAQSYSDYNLNARREASLDARNWLQKRLDESQNRIVEGSAALVAYQKAHDLADAQEAINAISASVAALSQQRGQATTERVLLQTSLDAHEGMLARGEILELAKDIGTPELVSLLETYGMASTDVARAAARYGEKMPERKRAEADAAGVLDAIRGEVAKRVNTERIQLRIAAAEEGSLGAALDEAKAQLLARQSVTTDYESLRLDVQRARDLFDTLSKRDDELDLAASTQLNNVRIIEAARPSDSPIKPDIPLNLMIALVSGLLGGVVLALARAQLDDTIRSPMDIAAFVRVPYLGLVPELREVSDPAERALYTHRHPKSAAAECMRAIRTMLELNPAGVGLRRLLVTSAVASEGKTESSVRLAVSYANLGRRVLLVDADLRRPRIHRVFETDRETGLSDLLNGRPVEPRPTEVPNVWVLPAGGSVERPNELLASDAMARCLDEWSARFDLVLLDTPPAQVLSDAMLLSRRVDGVVLVIRNEAVSRQLVRDTVRRLQQVGAPIIGVVVNAVATTGRAYRYRAYYGYGYGYGYGVGYGNDPAEKPDSATG
jgi:capsular exopolysaccharide synthesis family protein